ncbi:uncharacterized protein LOC130743999 [Lotus japonicus]|uniref:uncharacterized protein LOC130743999 n=1 Tax=Lotus japonicus TaxID=34305 RepID=UPI002583FCB5|nr:uncharacterized protein LOC130743999 [Lotus japonicus]
MGRIADAFGVPRNEVANPVGAAANNFVEVNAVPQNVPLQANAEVAAVQGGRNQLDNPGGQMPPNIENPILINRNMDADRIVERVRQNNVRGHQNIAGIVEQLLNQHGFNVGYANPPHFTSAFSEFVLQTELPRGWKVPKFTKFSGDTGESTVEHIARYQIEAGDIANNESLKMKYFPSSLTKNAFTWFTTLLPNSIHNWVQLERVFHEQFFRGESKVSLKELASVKRKFKETIDDYLNRFRQMKSKCFTQVPEHELVEMAAGGLDYSIRKKIDTQHLRDMAQLADRVRQIENLKLEKEKFNRVPKKGKIAFVESCEYEVDYDSYQGNCDDVEQQEVDVAELVSGPPYVCRMLKPYESKNAETNKGVSKLPVKAYNFDVTKCDAIYDILLKDGQIKIPPDQKEVPFDQRKGKKFCKFHNVFSHWTNNCVRFRDLVQTAIKEGRLKFE